MIRTCLLLLLAACAQSPGAAPAIPVSEAAVPSASLYHLQPDLTDQRGARVRLDVHRGHATIVSMFYASCPSACPMLMEEIKALEATLSPAERAELRVLLVSLDPSDTPERFAEVIRAHGLDDARWTLVRAAADDVRAIAATLGVRYRPDPKGGMNHSSVKTLVDAQGRPVVRLEGLGRDAAPLRDAVAAARRST